MNCDSVTKLIPLYYYGELTPGEEDQLDQHLHECRSCTKEMEQQRLLAAALDRRQVELPPLLLDECRDDLLAAIAGGAPRQIQPSVKGPWTLFLQAMSASLANFGRLRQPLTAMLLVGLGFVAARFTGSPATQTASAPSDNVFANVRSVSSGTDGRVHLTVDETRRREITGRPEDPSIQQLLLAGSRDENAAVRVEAVGLMKNRSDSPQVQDSLLNALSNDPYDGVRLKALDALKSVAGDPKVTSVLAHVLLTDANPAVRMQVIDLMSARRDDTVIKLLQSLMDGDRNSGVRSKASKVLKDWNASIGTF